MTASDPVSAMLVVQRAWTAAMAVGVITLIALTFTVVGASVDGEFWGRRIVWWAGLTRAASFALLLNAAILWGIGILASGNSRWAAGRRR